ncbi:nitroreductase [Desulfosporosinus acidiphilus SJ4]|uniref:Nitroreductase n=1 Tax=Desulfosporosinus acidiphilus (strain DSM 22704 / JCM 16185 / SJ4) TaxID=646529 RepID=I4D101_DESAJ|nr:nitroreductase family protein [Desulfosporosinus acidiphilus]AFM39475.1 nitroreductase [Desulfosporosinus acidiphilus SJ4]
MNQTIETIMKRKGSMSYTAEQIKESDMTAIISSGIAGPTGRNFQNRHFTVVQNAELLRQINDGIRTLMSAPVEYNPLYGAPTLIITSAPIDSPFAEQDCAAAVENMALAATALGLGSRYLLSPTRFIESEAGKTVKQALAIPEGYRSVACLIAGYDADPSQAPVTRNMDVVNYVK